MERPAKSTREVRPILKIGTVTIGETPRTAVLSDIRSLMTTDVQIVEKGALDDLSPAERANLAPQAHDEMLVTRMRDGHEVVLGRNRILPRLQHRITELDREAEVSLIALLCSGAFPPFECTKPFITPYQLLRGVLASMSVAGRVGMMVPSADQIQPIMAGYADLGHKMLVMGVSPFAGREGIARAAETLRGKVDVVFMNCFGYDLVMKSIVRQTTGKPVILPRSLLARTIDDLLNGFCSRE